MKISSPRIEISIATQRLRLFDGLRLIREWPCSSSKYGLGTLEGSNKTPLGRFVVREKHGAEARSGTIFKSRQPTGHWQPGMETSSDLVLTRILWLAGAEERNANTFQRYIYIHGTNNEAGIGKPLSHGCIRLRNADVITLFDLVPEGTEVWIQE
jgi:L,D-transpeptidase YbiS